MYCETILDRPSGNLYSSSEVSEVFPPSAMREPTSASRHSPSDCRRTGSNKIPSPESDGSEHQSAIANAQLPVNNDGAEGLEFGGGHTKVDPSVAAGQL